MDLISILGFIVLGFFLWGGLRFINKSKGQPVVESPLDRTVCDQHKPAPPKFLARIKKDIGTTIWAVSEDGHFLRVYGEKGEDRILYRFSDAVHDLRDFDGTAVHLSHWVLSEAIDHTEQEGFELFVVLKNGVKIPVSGTYRRVLEESGLA